MNRVFIEHGGPVVKLRVNYYTHTFEMHPYMGPCRCYADGEPMNKDWPKNSAFWPAFEKWQKQGQRVDEHGFGVIDED